MRARHMLLFLSAMGMLSCSKDLSRSRAVDLISRSDKFTTTIELKVPVGTLWWDHRNIAADLGHLTQKGIIMIRETGQKEGWWSKEYISELTPIGQEASKGWTLTKEPMMNGAPYKGNNCWTVQGKGELCHEAKGSVYSVVLAHRNVNEVTGITSDPAGKEAQAEFTWEWKPTANAKLFAERVPTGVQKGAAVFQLYDDGWRQMQIQY